MRFGFRPPSSGGTFLAKPTFDWLRTCSKNVFGPRPIPSQGGGSETARGELKGLATVICSLAACSVTATEAVAQSTPRSGAARQTASRTADLNRQQAPITVADPFANERGSNPVGALLTGLGNASLDGEFGFAVQDAAFGPTVQFQSDTDLPRAEPFSLSATRRTDIWFDAGNHSDRLRLTTRGALRRADGAPLPVTLRDRSQFDTDAYDVSYTRGWSVARGYTPSGLEVSLTPHAGFGVGDEGGSAEAGATLKIGENLDRLAPDGRERFGDRARWYLYAAGSGRAVGYNFARTRDGDYARSGVSQDKGSFLGDASIGVAYRRGPMQGSFGVVYREIKAEGLRGGEGFDREVSEGLVAFQLSIRPQW